MPPPITPAPSTPMVFTASALMSARLPSPRWPDPRCRPVHAASSRSLAPSAITSSGSSACGPSQRASAGFACTSTMIPSAPAATAASAIGATSVRPPVPCDGSTITGRCERSCATTTAERSSVLRVDGSNVRMPRSHRMMSRLPECATYSAASSHSSTVAAKPRLIITGLPVCAHARSRSKFCMLRAPTRTTSTTSATASSWRTSSTSATHGRPNRLALLRHQSRPSTPRPWNEYGDVRCL